MWNCNSGRRLFSSTTVNVLKPFLGPSTPIPTYRILSKEGTLLNAKEEPKLDKTTLRKMYTDMVGLTIMDGILYEAQRQGRISFYMTSHGEEATQIGSAAAMAPNDPVFAQYREAGVLWWRGFGLEEFMNQCYGNRLDPGKGRQMPVHYGSRRLHYQTISSPLATQIPQAVGAAYALKMRKEPSVVICYFGEGAASEGDFHAGLNMAAIVGAPVVFFCRNNGWAISTPASEQFRGDGIASRGPGYGIPAIRVDGTDLLAVYNATTLARKMAIDGQPVLVEAMTVRVGHHSTSDDSSAYRDKAEIAAWSKENDPIERFRLYLRGKNFWTDSEDEELRSTIRNNVMRAFAEAEKIEKPALQELFTNVYSQMPWNLSEQQKELQELVQKYPKSFPSNHQ